MPPHIPCCSSSFLRAFTALQTLMLSKAPHMPLISTYGAFDASSLGARYTMFVLAWAWKEVEAWLLQSFTESMMALTLYLLPEFFASSLFTLPRWHRSCVSHERAFQLSTQISHYLEN